MRLRGFSLMAMLLDEYMNDPVEVILPVFDILKGWPLISRNKISSTNVEELVTKLVQTAENEQVKEKGQSLLTSWSELELAYRIPKALRVGRSSHLCWMIADGMSCNRMQRRATIGNDLLKHS